MARRRMLLLVAVVALALAVSAAAISAALNPPVRPVVVAPTPGPSQVARPTPGTSGVLRQTPGPSGVVRGWPDTSTNGAGLYSWDGSTCASQSCSYGFMHNGYGSGDVEIRIHRVTGGPIPTHNTTPVRLAGHDAIYRQTGPGDEDWFVEIEGTMIAINLDAVPGTSESDLADAHTIIESLRTEPRDSALGFRLVFFIPTGDWDSG